VPESHRTDDPRYVDEVGTALANGLTRPVEIMRLNHSEDVLSVAYSPDGSHIVSGSLDKTLRIWDAQTGALIVEPLSGHENSVWSVAYSPDGSRIVSGSYDNTLRLWNAGLFTASLKELIAKAEKLCPLNLEERQRLRLIDPQVEAAQKPLTPDQRRACGE